MTKPTREEAALKERARKLGYKLKRRGKEYRLFDSDGVNVTGATADGISWWLGTIERKETIRFSSPCGIPLWTAKLGQDHQQ